MTRKIIVSLGFLAIALSVVVGRTNVASGYEVDIYASTPPLFWALVGFSMASGMGLIMMEAFKPDGTNTWVQAFALVVVGNLVLGLLPAIRGYAMFNIGDSSGHVGLTRDIVQTGHITAGNPYPVIHVLIWAMSRFGGVDLNAAALRLPALQSALSMISIYLVASAVLEKREQVLFAAAGVPVLSYAYYQVSVYPAGQAVLFLPFILYLYFRGNDKEGSVVSYRALLILSVPVLVFFHPTVAVVLIAYLLVLELAKMTWNQRAPVSPVLRKEEPSFHVFLLAFVIAFMWMSVQLWFPGYVSNFVGFLRGDILASGHLETIPSVIEGQNMSLFDVVFTALKRFGGNIVFVLLGVMSCVALVTLFWKRKLRSWRPFALAPVFLVSAPVWLFVFLGSRGMTLGRFLGDNPALWAAPVLAGFILYATVSWARGKAWAFGAAGALLFITWALSAISVFPSPTIMRVNMQITHSEIAGVTWFTEHNDPRYEIITMGTTPPMESSVVGYTESVFGREDVIRWHFWRAIGVGGLQSDNFMYVRYDNLGEWQTGRSYILMSDRFRQGSTFPAFQRGVVEGFNVVAPWITEEHMQRLENDSTVDRVYSNGGFDVFVIANTSHH